MACLDGGVFTRAVNESLGCHLEKVRRAVRSLVARRMAVEEAPAAGIHGIGRVCRIPKPQGLPDAGSRLLGVRRGRGGRVVLFVFLFIASHAVGQGAVIWVRIAEIFPNSVRARGQSLGSGTHRAAAASIALLMPYFLGRFQPQDIFAFFCVMMVLQLLFVLFPMPETRGRTLESLAEELSGSRPGR